MDRRIGAAGADGAYRGLPGQSRLRAHRDGSGRAPGLRGVAFPGADRALHLPARARHAPGPRDRRLGVSGGGKKASVGLLGSETMGNLGAYNTAGRHRHNPEIVQNLSGFRDEQVRVSFTPVLAPLPRGILTTATAPLRGDITEDAARQAYTSFYAGETFIHLLPQGRQPRTQNVVGSNMCHLQVEVDSTAGKLVVTSAIDNLTKGTAGAAVQCMNLALGWEETDGLPLVGVAP